MRPYIVRPCDHLLKIAARERFAAEEAWNAAENAELRQKRGTMHVLQGGDVLWLPESAPPRWFPVKVGETNRFTAILGQITMQVTFMGPRGPVAGQRCRIRELPALEGLATDSQGTLTFQAPATLETATVEWTGTEVAFELRIGELDPARSASGRIQRLVNLGYLTDDDLADEADRDERVRQALAHFQWAAGLDRTGEVDEATLDALIRQHGC